jgi:hypothetical protein
MIALQPGAKNRASPDALLDGYCEKMQEDAAIAKILRLASMEGDDEAEEMPNIRFPL